MRPRERCRSVRAPARDARARTSRSGLTTRTSARRPAAWSSSADRDASARGTSRRGPGAPPRRASRRAGSSLRRGHRLARSPRSAAGRGSASGPVTSPMVQTAGRRSDSAKASVSRATRARAASSVMIVSVVKVASPSAAISGSRAASIVSRTNPSRCAARRRGHAGRGRCVAERREHPVGRALQRAAADDAADRDDRRARFRGTRSRRSVMPGTARIGPIDTIGFDGPMTTSSAASTAATTSAVGAAVLDAAEPDFANLGRLVAMHEVLLELEPAVVGQDLGAHLGVRHRQDRGGHPDPCLELARDAGRPPSPRAAGPFATGAWQGRGRRDGTTGSSPSAARASMTVHVSSARPQPRSASSSPASV